MSKKVIVIGGGAAGMMAAGIAAKRGHKVVLLEKNKQLGKKLFITGNSRCNITNNTDIQGLIDNIPGNGNFLYSAFYTFSNYDLINFFNDLGLSTKVEREGRVFPTSDKSSDVINTLIKFLKKNNVEIRLNSPVKDISKENNKFKIILSNSVLFSDRLIIATGGVTYPATGSTGDGYKFAKKFGHKIIDLKPSLIPLVSSDSWIPDLQGLSLKDISIKLLKNNKVVFTGFGEMLFTHYGVSGPVVLNSSRHLIDSNFSKDNIKLIIDLNPTLSEEKLNQRIQQNFEKYINKDFQNSLNDLLPRKLIPVIVKLSNIKPNKKVNQITKEERLNLIRLLKNFTVNISGTRPIEEGVVTCGGVSTNEINPKTMESKIIKGLFFAGEIIDVDGYTGGFNLQIAFSTGYVAGMNV